MDRRSWIFVSTIVVLAGGLGCTEQAIEDEEEEVGTDAAGASSVHRFGWATIDFGPYVNSAGSYNSTGGHITVVHLGNAVRRVTFEGFPYSSTSNAHVSGWHPNGNRMCSLVGPPSGNSTSTVIEVMCYAGNLSSDASSEFLVTLDSNPNTQFSPNRGAFLSTTGGTAPAITHSWNSSGGTNTAIWNPGAQWFEVSLPGLQFENAGVHVTAITGEAKRCKVVSWGNGVVRVRCYEDDPAVFGTNPIPTSNVGFSLSYQEISQIPGKVGGHAWVSNSNVIPSYSAALSPSGPCDAPPSFGYQGFSPTHNHPGVVSAEIYLSNSSWNSPTAVNVPMVTAYGSSAQYCNVSYWGPDGTGTRVGVICYEGTGMSPLWGSQSQFTLSLSSWGDFKVCP